jgi:hypothetical protein
MIIELLHDLNFYAVHLANEVRPAPPAPLIGLPPKEIVTLDNSVHYPKGKRLKVDHDEEWEQVEPHDGETWFKSAEHPGGFRVPNADFRYIDPAKD